MNAQSTRVVLFLLMVLCVVLASGWSALLIIADRAAKKPPQKRRLARVSFTLLGLGFCCFGYALFIEADWLEVTRVTIETKKWAAGKKLRIAHLSDLHVDGQTRALTRLAEVLRDEQVDLIVFTGDSLNKAEAAPLFRSTLGGLPARLGRMAVRGNHDVVRWGKVELFGGGIATELFSDAPVMLENGTLAVCGAPFRALDGVDTCLASAPAEAFVLFAYHTPDLVEGLGTRPDLYLAGHTHGGQVAMPIYGALITMSNFDKKYESGRYEVNGTTLYVNRGIGFEPHMPRVRFFARPEVTIIELMGVGGG
jgi:uncharacterized protein